MSRGNDAGRTRALTALATTAAAAAVVTVLVTTAVATQKFASRQTDAAPATGPTSSNPSIGYPSLTPVTSTVFEDGQIVSSDAASNAYFEVPSRRDGWTTSTLEDWIEIPAVIDGPKPRALQPASYRKGYCEADPEDALAYVGLGVPLDPDGVEGSDNVKGCERADHEVLAGFPCRRGERGPSRRTRRPAGKRVDARRRDNCLDVIAEEPLAARGGARLREQSGRRQPAQHRHRSEVATVTAFRFLGTGADLPAETLQKILESVHPLPGEGD